MLPLVELEAPRKVVKKMSRSVEPKVVLPRVDAEGSVTLAKALVTAIQAERRLPAVLVKPAKSLKSHSVELQHAASPRARPARSDLRKRQLEESASWKSLYNFLLAWSDVPEQHRAHEVEDAKRILETLFPDGLKFVRLPFKKEWGAAELRLQSVRDLELDDRIRALGGGVFLDSVRLAHRISGEILGVTKVKAMSPQKEGRSTKDVIASFNEVLREFVVQVTAYSRQGHKGARELAERLLAPLKDWEDAPAKASVEEEPAPPAPAPVAVPPVT
jgi:hypothetical protein